jgi:magnesium transporter
MLVHTERVGEERGAYRSRVWRDGQVVADDFPFDQISDYLEQDGCLVWVDICDPDSKQLTDLAHELLLDPLAVEDAVGQRERAKAVRYATHIFLTAYAVRIVEEGWPPDSDNGDPGDSLLRFYRISAFVMPRGVITVRRPSGFDMDAVVQRWDDNADLLKHGVGTLMHGLLDVIVDGHFDAVQALDDTMESLEDDLFDEKARTTAVQRQTYQVRKDLVSLRRVILPMREVINAVLRHRKDLHAPSELDSWYDDLYDHVLRASEWTESLRDMVTTIFETNLSLQDARLNTVMKKLTGWAAIIAVPTAVTGYFGQNVPYPGFGKQWGVIFSLAIMIGTALTLYVTFRRKGWL